MTNAPNQVNDDYTDFQIALQDSLGVVLGEDYRGRIEGRLQNIMSRERLSRLSDLARALRDDQSGSIRSDVLEAISSHEVDWFRYTDIDRLVRDYILPSLMQKQKSCRIWYPGCGIGHAAFSLAMVIDDTLSTATSPFSVEMLATDASSDAVDKASSCIFLENELDGMPIEYRQRYLHDTGDGYKVDQRICKMLTFKACDLVDEAATQSSFDVIISPDVLMYFSNGTRRQILEDFSMLLEPAGILVLNQGETVIPFCDRFEMVKHDIATFYRQKE